MSYQNFEKALELAKACDGYDDGGGKSLDTIRRAEELLGLVFSKQNLEYFSRLGYMEFFGTEVYGIVKDDFSGIPAGNCVESALADRQEYDLPAMWLPIYFFDDGYMGYLDYSQLNDEGEPLVIMALYNGTEFIVTDKIAEDLGDFLLSLVEEQLASQN